MSEIKYVPYLRWCIGYNGIESNCMVMDMVQVLCATHYYF